VASRSDPDERLGWYTVLACGIVIAIVVSATCGGCAGPYVGPDLQPDRLDVGYTWGDLDSSGAIHDVAYAWPTDAGADAELWTVTVGWDLGSQPQIQRERQIAVLERMAADLEAAREAVRAREALRPPESPQNRSEGQEDPEGLEWLLDLLERRTGAVILLLTLAPALAALGWLGVRLFRRGEKPPSGP
jgi:hypothetical protein